MVQALAIFHPHPVCLPVNEQNIPSESDSAIKTIPTMLQPQFRLEFSKKTSIFYHYQLFFLSGGQSHEPDDALYTTSF
jgi:hypothetical protein